VMLFYMILFSSSPPDICVRLWADSHPLLHLTRYSTCLKDKKSIAEVGQVVASFTHVKNWLSGTHKSVPVSRSGQCRYHLQNSVSV
jgi:hypothetical protein